jgi:hypothetical protein
MKTPLYAILDKAKPDIENYTVFEKELCNGIPNVTLWQVLRHRLHLKAYKLSIVQHLELVLFVKCNWNDQGGDWQGI